MDTGSFYFLTAAESISKNEISDSLLGLYFVIYICRDWLTKRQIFNTIACFARCN